MSVQIKIEVGENAKEIVRTLQTMPRWMLADIAKAMDNENAATAAHIQLDYLSFPRHQPSVKIGCRVQSGLLRGSLRPSAAVIRGDSVQSAIGSNMQYAAAQEFGADIPAHTIYPKPGNKALKFKIGDRVIFAKKVNVPAIHLEGRAFVQRGINDRAPQYSAAITKAIVDGWNNGGQSK